MFARRFASNEFRADPKKAGGWCQKYWDTVAGPFQGDAGSRQQGGAVGRLHGQAAVLVGVHGLEQPLVRRFELLLGGTRS